VVIWRRVYRRARDLALRRLFGRARQPIVQAVGRERLSYLEPVALDDLVRAVQELEEAERPGAIVEGGCGLGGSAIVIAATKARSRPFYVYDIFGMPPPPNAADGPDAHERSAIVMSGRAAGIRGTQYYGYRPDVLGEVAASFARHRINLARDNVHLVTGLIQQTLNIRQPVALAHLDCDRHDSVKTCLERIVPYLVPGGRLVIDDYLVWSGCRRAVDEYFASQRSAFRFVWKARLHVIRRQPREG
jgi:Macrocin-O-methyltransferase (TylF)